MAAITQVRLEPAELRRLVAHALGSATRLTRPLSGGTANLLADADRWRVRLPRPASEIEALVGLHAPALDAVAAPHLVHFDLWDGNLFVDGEGDSVRLGGLIDGERAFWGDPLFEMASLALFGEIEGDAAFLQGYAEEQGAPLLFDELARTRVALAQLYLYLIMWIEPAPRAFGVVRRVATRHYVGRFLRRALRRLAPRPSESARPRASFRAEQP